jgi:hypothetical protein
MLLESANGARGVDVGQESGLVHKRHRRGKKRRDKVRLALRVGLSMLLIGMAAALSAGIIHVVERPVPPFEAIADELGYPLPPEAPVADPGETRMAETQPGS